MDKFELWQVSSFHFWPRWWVLERAGLLRGYPSCSDGISSVIELGWKGNLFFPGICQGSFWWYCWGAASKPEIIYTGRFDRIEKSLYWLWQGYINPTQSNSPSLGWKFFVGNALTLVWEKRRVSVCVCLNNMGIKISEMMKVVDTP